MDILQVLSIILEIVAVIFALLIALKNGKLYGYGFALTFAIYVYYDSAKYFNWEVSNALLSPIFFVATVSAVMSLICLFYKTNK